MSSHAPGLENRELFKSPRSVHLPSAMSKAPIVKREFCFPSDVQLLSVIDFPLRIANFVEKLPTLHALQFRLRLSDRSCVKDRSGTERQNDATAARRRRRQQQPEEQQRSARGGGCIRALVLVIWHTNADGNAHAHAPRATVSPRGGGGGGVGGGVGHFL